MAEWITHRTSYAPPSNNIRKIAALTFIAALSGCSSHYARIDSIMNELSSISPPWFKQNRSTFRNILATTLSQDAYVCDPLPSNVFNGPAPIGSRDINGTMPHYGFYFGPMHYTVSWTGAQWRVYVRYAVEVSDDLDEIELPDCKTENITEARCKGIAFSQSDTRETCPDSGQFRAEATLSNIQALLARWSTDAEEYYNRDAKAFDLPITYNFTFTPIPPDQMSDGSAHIRLPLSPSCGRTPYFLSLRTGWSMPILAHEVGHMLGLLDEYEMFSGIVWFYPKTPFKGAEQSRFGLSMIENTVVLPLHHYLVLRRYFCPEPSSRNPYHHAVASAPISSQRDQQLDRTTMPLPRTRNSERILVAVGRFIKHVRREKLVH